MRRITSIAVASFVLLSAATWARAAVPPNLGNLWDVANGTTVTGGSPTDDFFNGHIANLTNMFEPKVNVARPFEDDSVNTLFGDKQPAGFVHFVEWQTPSAVTLGSFKLYTVDDHPSFLRSFDHFTLYAWNGVAFAPIFDSATGHPYVYDDPAHVLLFDRDVTPVTSNRFRAEFTQNGTIGNGYLGVGTYGPRVLELAAFAPDPVPPQQDVPLPPAAFAGMFTGMMVIVTRVRRAAAA
jgi:hypothetical protein